MGLGRFRSSLFGLELSERGATAGAGVAATGLCHARCLLLIAQNGDLVKVADFTDGCISAAAGHVGNDGFAGDLTRNSR